MTILSMVLSLFFFSEGDSEKIKDYDIIKDKMLPKCLEFKEAGSMDLLKDYDTQLWLMCMEIIIDNDTMSKGSSIIPQAYGSNYDFVVCGNDKIIYPQGTDCENWENNMEEENNKNKKKDKKHD